MKDRQKLGIEQKNTQALSIQQMQFTKLLHLSNSEMYGRIQNEIEKNPVLEEEKNSAQDEEEMHWEDSLLSNDSFRTTYAPSKRIGQGAAASLESRLPSKESLFEQLMQQLNLLNLEEKEYAIGEHLVGSLDADGYMRRDLHVIANDLLIMRNLSVDTPTVARVLTALQRFDPPGILATTLQECLIIQLRRKMVASQGSAAHEEALRILKDHFATFAQKKYTELLARLPRERRKIAREAIDVITKLNPKPANPPHTPSYNTYLHPDFVVTCEDSRFHVALNKTVTPRLRISPLYLSMIKKGHRPAEKEAVSYVKKKVAAAHWFVDALLQREHTLLRTMRLIVEKQEDFFREGDPALLSPMVLKDIAEEIGVHVSTISRIVSNKSVQTTYGVYPLRYFFNEALQTEEGNVSNRAVQVFIKDLISEEDKAKPLSDQKIEGRMKEAGYHIARRTVTKYREKMKIPIARLRKAW